MTEDPKFWLSNLSENTTRMWFGIFAGMIYVYQKSPHPSKLARVFEACASGMIAYAIAPEAARLSGINETIAALVLSSVGYLLLDVFTSIVKDREVIKGILARKLGGGNGK